MNTQASPTFTLSQSNDDRFLHLVRPSSSNV